MCHTAFNLYFSYTYQFLVYLYKYVYIYWPFYILFCKMHFKNFLSMMDRDEGIQLFSLSFVQAY